MIRRWLPALAFGLVVALVAYQVALVQTPRLLMAAAGRRLAAQGGSNTFVHGPLATSASRAVVRPSPDLAYSSCVVDLSDGPVRVSVPTLPARYWSLSVFDARTDVAFVANNVERNGQPISIVLARAGQVVPPGSTVVTLKGDRAIALIRALVEDRSAFPALDRARRGAVCKADPS
jgi:uncharacterized membrane protein